MRSECSVAIRRHRVVEPDVLIGLVWRRARVLHTPRRLQDRHPTISPMRTSGSTSNRKDTTPRFPACARPTEPLTPSFPHSFSSMSYSAQHLKETAEIVAKLNPDDCEKCVQELV